MLPQRLYVDEVKAPVYLLIATSVNDANLSDIRKSLRRHVLPGQRRLHFHTERESRQQAIFSTIQSIAPVLSIYVSAQKSKKPAREMCLAALMRDSIVRKYAEVVIELDRSVVEPERKQLANLARSQIAYRHEEPHQEPALWISDAVGWAYRRGGAWRAKVINLNPEIIFVD